MRSSLALALFVMGLAQLPSIAAAQTVTSNSVSLTWTAPGDDSLTGTAAQYDLRYSTVAITATNFSTATRFTGTPTPAAPGSPQTVTVTGLQPSTTYYFAIKTGDDAPERVCAAPRRERRDDAHRLRRPALSEGNLRDEQESQAGQ